MANCSTKEKMKFAYAMAKHSNATLHDLQRILRYGATYHGIQERECNGYANTDWGRAQEARDKDKARRMEAKLRSETKSFGADVTFGGDPRGCTVKIVVPDGYTNDWGKEGICVPTA